jgi:hypothetical protein
MFQHFLSNKIMFFFVSVVYLNLFLDNVVVPPAIYFCLSSVSHLNSLTFLHLIMFILLSSVSRLNSHCFLTLLLFNIFKSS